MEKDFIQKTIELSQRSVNEGGFPVGALVVIDDEIIGVGVSDGKNNYDATSHAEIEAIRQASKRLKKRDLWGATVYSSMEPCLMCLHASFWAKVDTVVYAVKKSDLDSMYFEGSIGTETASSALIKNIKLIHAKELEKEALQVVKEWESLIKK